MRTGIGYDVHPLVPGRRLVLGGVEIPFNKGLDGWSDADAPVHAIIDALLGAACLGDIGQHFPPGAAEYRDISSLALLRRVKDLLTENGWQVNNIDVTIITEQPRLSQYIDPIREQLSRTLDISTSRVSVKGKTSAGLGFIGRGEGIAALSVVLIEEIQR